MRIARLWLQICTIPFAERNLMNQPTPTNPTPSNASSDAPKFEIRYATYAALEKLKSEVWMDFDHEKPTVVVCVWDGAGAVDSINVFTSFESAIDERGAREAMGIHVKRIPLSEAVV